jgi:hypothetical protein
MRVEKFGYEKGIYEQTLIIFTSDTGAPLGQLELKDADDGWITYELKKIAGSASCRDCRRKND